MSIKHDYHMHSDFSGDCSTPADSMIQQAIALQLSGICFTEHHDLDVPTDIDFTIDFKQYFSRMQDLQKQYQGQIHIGIGMEFGLQKQLSPILHRLTQTYPFDFIIVSQHFVDQEDPYYPAFFEGKEERAAYERYFEEQYETLKQFKDFDTLGHMDYIVRYGPDQNKYYSYKNYADYIDPLLKYLIENGKCLEVNTGGFRYGLGETNPAFSVLKRYHELGGELITIGSDAHTPDYIHYEFNRACSALLELGYRYYTIFAQRQPIHIPLH